MQSIRQKQGRGVGVGLWWLGDLMVKWKGCEWVLACFGGWSGEYARLPPFFCMSGGWWVVLSGGAENVFSFLGK